LRRIPNERSGLKKRHTIALLLAGVVCMPSATSLGRLVTDQSGRRVDIPASPQRVVSLAPNITEIIYALGLGDRLVGDTDYCDYPPEAKLKPHVGSIVNPSLESIAALKPDLVFGTADANRRETADQLERLGIPLYGLAAHTFDDAMQSIEDVGDVLGQGAKARSIVEGLRKRAQAVEQRIQGQPRPRVLFVVWYRPLITAGSHTFLSDVIRRAGGIPLNEGLRGEWPRLSLEEVLRREPDVILFPRTESFSPALDEFTRLPGWRELRAVKEHHMYFVPETIMRPCPRLVDALEQLAGILHPVSGSPSEARK